MGLTMLLETADRRRQVLQTLYTSVQVAVLLVCLVEVRGQLPPPRERSAWLSRTGARALYADKRVVFFVAPPVVVQASFLLEDRVAVLDRAHPNSLIPVHLEISSVLGEAGDLVLVRGEVVLLDVAGTFTLLIKLVDKRCILLLWYCWEAGIAASILQLRGGNSFLLELEDSNFALDCVELEI